MHIADIQTKENVIIELQNSPIPTPIIYKRETFYGKKMMWIINGKPFKENFEIYKSQLKEDEEYYRRYNPSSSQYGLVDNGRKNEFDFSWSRCRKSWRDAQRRIFIDFGDENLFWVKEGMGTHRGCGRQVSKKDFIAKYGGDLELLALIIDNSNKKVGR